MLKILQVFRFLFLYLIIITAGTAFLFSQENEEKWDYFQFSDKQYFKYKMISERGLEGWTSIQVKKGSDDSFDISISGRWTSEFSETVNYRPGMSSFDFIFSAENFEIATALGSLMNIDGFIVDNTVFKKGFEFSEGDKKLKIKGTDEYCGISGFILEYSAKNPVNQTSSTSIYNINTALPLPLYAKVPAANDTWIYELVEFRK